MCELSLALLIETSHCSNDQQSILLSWRVTQLCSCRQLVCAPEQQSVADKVMNDPLLLELISEQIDIKSSINLARTSHSFQSNFERTQTNYWWYRHTQLLLCSSLEGEVSDDWRSVYLTLYRALKPSIIFPFTEQVLSSILCTRLLLTSSQREGSRPFSMLAHPSSRTQEIVCSAALDLACALSKIEVIPLLLSDESESKSP